MIVEGLDLHDFEGFAPNVEEVAKATDQVSTLSTSVMWTIIPLMLAHSRLFLNYSIGQSTVPVATEL